MVKGFVGLARTIHVISALWVLLIAVVIIVDVLGRALYSSPLQGATEVIRNSVVAITFLQLPLAILSGSMLRTELVSESLGPGGRRFLRTLAYLLGLALFALIVYADWRPAMLAYRIGEYEGEGALRIPVWPVHFILLVTSAMCAISYLLMIWLDWTNQLEDEIAYPGILAYDREAAAVMGLDNEGRSSAQDREPK
ncbi:TRAP transporter small permease [Aquamicrobium sp. LC103]|uniref:TRAP transporter small permease n=1 Tax=Aquamicrobium sp. LC103 TaxID=1120658 RepID=UPI00063E7508|nr:TRAP transporter small permease [Aquamicrobium sp. LC103]TKT69229.1 TRAP transporter small permease [Aquamicrobium sp. LC103]